MSQLPGVKAKKSNALEEARQSIATTTGRWMNEKQISKKVANMKSQVKRKTDARQIGNSNFFVLASWEQQLFNILSGGDNLTIIQCLAQ